MPGDFRERVLPRRLQHPYPPLQRFQPRREAVQRAARVAGGHFGLERGEARGEPFGERVLLGMQPAEPVGEIGRARHFGLERAERRLGRALGVAQGVEAGAEPRQRLARRLALEPGQPGLERGEPRRDRGDRRVLLRLHPAELLEECRLRRPGSAGGRGAFQRLQPLAEPLEEPARLGGVADLLDHPHPAA